MVNATDESQLMNQCIRESEPSPMRLTGKTILVTRAAGQSGEFTQLLQQAGATVLEMPALEIGPPSSWQELDAAIAQLTRFDWLILTSTNGVDAFFSRLAHHPQPLDTLKIAVVGKKTAQRLQSQGREPDFIPPDYVADALVQHFPQSPQNQRILFPRVQTGGREVLVAELTAKGAQVTEVAAYQSQCPSAIAPAILTALDQGDVDVITFASSKTVKCFQQLVGGDRIAQIKSCIASIGPQTSVTCQQVFGRVDVEASEYTLAGLTAALCDWVSRV